ncbi:hypothetical protein GCM10015535_42410 [Streptomyces gelaticus]|uniref:Uncharacterized protein n=1 Tax=Streptomyces gelaticus TaxID=285446 RepID=A0ABQ2W1L4_9ACTN|nr:hypothetical protein GCM10015535_42410 [Streptomyces gelaticus]
MDDTRTVRLRATAFAYPAAAPGPAGGYGVCLLSPTSRPRRWRNRRWAVLTHATQSDPNAAFDARIMLDDRGAEREVRAHRGLPPGSLPGGSLPEDDLFAGVRPEPPAASASGGRTTGYMVASRPGRRGFVPLVTTCWAEAGWRPCGST